MAAPKLKYTIGNSASTTATTGITNTDTTVSLTSDTNFQAKSGEGQILMDEGNATEEQAYSTGLSGAALAIPLANRGLEGGSAQAHTGNFSIRGILSAGMWNDLIDTLLNGFVQSSGAVDTTKIVTPTGTQTLTNKTLTAPSMTAPAITSDANLSTGVNIQVNGADPKRGMYIPASALFPATTNGCASHAQGETTTNKINYKYLAFDASAEEYAWIHMPTPDYWDLSTITVTFHWTFASSSGDVIWGAAGLCRSNDDALDTALGTAVTVTDTALTAGDEHTTSATSAITIGGTPAKGDKLYLRVYRDADAGGDTLGADAYLMGITVKYGIGQYDDQ